MDDLFDEPRKQRSDSGTPRGPNARSQSEEARLLKYVFARQLRKAVNANKVSPAELGILTGLSANTIKSALQGDRLPNPATILKFAKALTCSSTWLTRDLPTEAEGGPLVMDHLQRLTHTQDVRKELHPARQEMDLKQGRVPVPLQDILIPEAPRPFANKHLPHTLPSGRPRDDSERLERKRLLGERLTLIMKVRHLPNNFAKGISEQAIWNIKKGNSWPNHQTWVRLADSLNLTVDQLKGEQEMTPNDFLGTHHAANLADAILKDLQGS